MIKKTTLQIPKEDHKLLKIYCAENELEIMRGVGHLLKKRNNNQN